MHRVFFKYSFEATKVVDGAVRAADLVHLHTIWHPLNTIARKACARHGRRYALMPHGMLDPYSLSQKRWRKKIYLAAVERKNLEQASRLIFTAEHERQGARESLPWLQSGEVIPLAADLAPCLPREDFIAKFTGLFPRALDRRCLLFLGRIHEKKGIDRLLKILPDVARRHPDVLLVIAGTGEPSYVAHVRGLAQNVEQHVLFTGMLTGEAKFGALAAASVFLLPSRQENFAVAMAEAMHSAVPVIITDKVDSWPSVQTAKAGFVVEEENVERGFALRIDEVLRSPEMARRLGKNGEAFAREHFTWERVARDMVSLYQGMLSN